MQKDKYNYNPWPIGQVPKELQRPELEQLKTNGYVFNDAREVIDICEKRIATFAGSKFCVITDCATHAMELAFRYLLDIKELKTGDRLLIPNHTYVSAAIMPIQLGFDIDFIEQGWTGVYQFYGSRVWDGAVRWKKNMYVGKNALQAVSFQIKKIIPVGKMGCLLMDNEEEYNWIKLASYDGRALDTPYTDPNHIRLLGYHYYATPEDCARALLLMDSITKEGDSGNHSMYPNVKEMLKL